MLRLHGFVVGDGTVGPQQPNPFDALASRAAIMSSISGHRAQQALLILRDDFQTPQGLGEKRLVFFDVSITEPETYTTSFWICAIRSGRSSSGRWTLR